MMKQNREEIFSSESDAQSPVSEVLVPEDEQENSGGDVHGQDPSEESTQSEATMDSLQQELNEKNEEAKVLNDKYLRLAADFENYKRRAQREQNDTVRFANEKLLKDLLPTIDNLELAIKAGKEQSSGDGIREGVELTYKQYLDTLTKLGINQFSSLGEPFDPAKHQAIAQIPSNSVPPNSIIDEYQKGYFLHDRILRPAMVTVATDTSEQQSDPHGEITRAEEEKKA